MRKFQHAVFCFYISRFDRGFYAWLLQMVGSVRADGWLGVFSDRQMTAKWLTDMFDAKTDFDAVIHILAGDAYFEQNKRDVARLERETRRRIIELWDTDPIFEKYPRLRGLGRNKEFEEMMAAQKQKTK